jgi:hypothetical protein
MLLGSLGKIRFSLFIRQIRHICRLYIVLFKTFLQFQLCFVTILRLYLWYLLSTHVSHISTAVYNSRCSFHAHARYKLCNIIQKRYAINHNCFSVCLWNAWQTEAVRVHWDKDYQHWSMLGKIGEDTAMTCPEWL